MLVFLRVEGFGWFGGFGIWMDLGFWVFVWDLGFCWGFRLLFGFWGVVWVLGFGNLGWGVGIWDFV